jgi:predicted alpha/beta hydrolase family esterase
MRQVLFIQGAGESVHDQWDKHLVDSLARELGPAYEIRYPMMPDEADPSYARWKPEIERELATLEPGAVIVGHSVGGTTLLHLLAEGMSATRLGAICLIAAPFIGPGGWESDEVEPRSDLGARLPRDVPIYLYHGLDDDEVPSAHVELYARALPQAQLRRLEGRDHQLGNQLAEVAADIRRLDQRSPASA